MHEQLNVLCLFKIDKSIRATQKRPKLPLLSTMAFNIALLRRMQTIIVRSIATLLFRIKPAAVHTRGSALTKAVYAPPSCSEPDVAYLHTA